MKKILYTLFVLLLSLTFVTGLTACTVVPETAAYQSSEREVIENPAHEIEDAVVSENKHTEEAEQIILIVTGRYGQGTLESNEMVTSILGRDNSQERFNVYFNWYNTVHEIGHMVDVILRSSALSEISLIESELFANAFAVAFWARYGDEETFNLLKELVPYALGNFYRPVAEDEDIFDLAGLFEAGEMAFTFNNYGWFQFSLVNHVLSEMRDLESIFTDAGLEFSEAPPQRTLTFSSIEEDDIPEILAAVFTVLSEWGIEMSMPIYHMLSDDPNMHMVVPGETFEVLESWGASRDEMIRVWPLSS